MEITDEQRRRAEANRLAALEKQRKRLAAAPPAAPWRLTKCPRLPPPTPTLAPLPHPLPPPTPTVAPPPPPPPKPARFLVVLEISSPHHFSLSPALILPLPPLTIERGRPVYRLADYDSVLRCVKQVPGADVQEIPYTTRVVVMKMSECCAGDRWEPDRSLPGFWRDAEVEECMGRLPGLLRGALLPFQVEGVRFGLRRGGRCLIADEMGLGKTIQAIAIACCFMDHGPILVVCPAVLRFSWAEELEHWLPFLLPKDIHLVFGRKDNLDRLETSPKVVVISYTMLSRLRKSMLNREWALMIVDESHNIRCTKKKSESKEVYWAELKGHLCNSLQKLCSKWQQRFLALFCSRGHLLCQGLMISISR